MPRSTTTATGTLTLNKLKIYEQDVMVIEPGTTLEEALMYGALSADIVGEEPIDMVLYNSYGKVRRRRRLAAGSAPEAARGHRWAVWRATLPPAAALALACLLRVYCC